MQRLVEKPKLEYSKQLVAIFEELEDSYKKNGLITKKQRNAIVADLQARKAEVAVYAVTENFDTDMLKCLLKGNQLKKMIDR